MVLSQVSRLLAASRGYTYLQVYQAIWFLMHIKNISVESFDKFGIGLLTSNDQNMQEAMLYMDQLKENRKVAAASALASKDAKVEKVKITRQKQKIKREEFIWDE